MARDAEPANLFQLVAAVQQQFGAGFLAPDHRAEIRVQHHGAAGVFEGMAVAGFHVAPRGRVLGEDYRMRIEFERVARKARQRAFRAIHSVQVGLGWNQNIVDQAVHDPAIAINPAGAPSLGGAGFMSTAIAYYGLTADVLSGAVSEV